jgi:hypothetical protein
VISPQGELRIAKDDKTDQADTDKKSGGQPGRVGSTLKKTDRPDDIKYLSVNRSTLPPGDYAHLTPEHLAEYAGKISNSAHFAHIKTKDIKKPAATAS